MAGRNEQGLDAGRKELARDVFIYAARCGAFASCHLLNPKVKARALASILLPNHRLDERALEIIGQIRASGN